MKTIELIIKKLEQVAHRENARISFEIITSSSNRRIYVYTSARLSMKGRRIIETALRLRTKPTKEDYKPSIIGRRGSKIEKDGTEITLTFYDVAECKIVGMKKEMHDVTKEIEPAKTIIIREEIEVPIYECPKGVEM